MARLLPANEAIKAAGSARSRMAMPASWRPAAQPSVRASRAATCSAVGDRPGRPDRHGWTGARSHGNRREPAPDPGRRRSVRGRARRQARSANWGCGVCGRATCVLQVLHNGTPSIAGLAVDRPQGQGRCNVASHRTPTGQCVQEPTPHPRRACPLDLHIQANVEGAGAMGQGTDRDIINAAFGYGADRLQADPAAGLAAGAAGDYCHGGP